jgi:glutamate-5-semialdehyde dehydrogenase
MNMDMITEMTGIAKKARDAFRGAIDLSSDVKDSVLREMADAVEKRSAAIIKANAKDISAAKSEGKPAAFIDRLALNSKRICDMSRTLREIASMADPVGKVISSVRRPNGLWINKVRVPIGVVAVIYESRPNVTCDCVGLCFKSGNSVILRGGSEALHSNRAIYSALAGVLKKFDIPEGMVSMVSTPDRRAVDALLGLSDYIDAVMPRGGESLIRKVVGVSKIPVIKHYKGICHVYVDDGADLNMAQDICFNAKVQRPGVCNAMESLLVHKDAAVRFLPGMAKKFRDAGVELRGCPAARKIVKWCGAASDEDYRTEFLDLVLAVKVVNSIDEAITHINANGSHHSDAIVTESYQNSLEFLRRVDSACVYVNASTRFTDGGQFGMGAEIGISTDKLHARGPVALEELTTYKYMVFGKGQVRE